MKANDQKYPKILNIFKILFIVYGILFLAASFLTPIYFAVLGGLGFLAPMIVVVVSNFLLFVLIARGILRRNKSFFYLYIVFSLSNLSITNLGIVNLFFMIFLGYREFIRKENIFIKGLEDVSLTEKIAVVVLFLVIILSFLPTISYFF